MPAEANNRSQWRSNVFLAAVLHVPGARSPVRVRNLSCRGALLEGERLPSKGTPVRLARGELGVEGEIAWQTSGQAGVRFADDVSVEKWVKRVGHEGQQRIDRTMAMLRGRDVRPCEDAPVDRPTVAQASRDLQEICARIASSDAISLELGEELLRLDALARTLQQLASQ